MQTNFLCDKRYDMYNIGFGKVYRNRECDYGVKYQLNRTTQH